MPLRVIGALLVCSMGLTGATVVSAQAPPPDLKARCTELLEFYDWYGADRSENSDGARNHTRISAGMDCTRGRYAEGVALMEALLRRKYTETQIRGILGGNFLRVLRQIWGR